MKSEYDITPDEYERVRKEYPTTDTKPFNSSAAGLLVAVGKTPTEAEAIEVLRQFIEFTYRSAVKVGARQAVEQMNTLMHGPADVSEEDSDTEPSSGSKGRLVH